MNALTKQEAQSLPVRLTSPYARTAVVSPWGFELECQFELDEGEPPSISNGEFDHPGWPDNVILLSCSVNGQDITEMLSLTQQERIEDAILEAIR